VASKEEAAVAKVSPSKMVAAKAPAPMSVTAMASMTAMTTVAMTVTTDKQGERAIWIRRFSKRLRFRRGRRCVRDQKQAQAYQRSC
jgi:hypothetical protein